jgi:hypothetical protein
MRLNEARRPKWLPPGPHPLTPDNFSSRDAIANRILSFQSHYQDVAGPLHPP